MSLLIFDTETNGLPLKKFNGVTRRNELYNPHTHLNAYFNSRVIQVGYCEYDKVTHKLISQYSTYIKPHDFEINNSHIHGITYQTASEKGIDMREVLNKLMTVLVKDDVTLLAYSIDFDINVLIAEAIRCRHQEFIKVFTSKCKIDIADIAQKSLKLTKTPRLADVYNHMFGKAWVQEHDALKDTQACASVYFECLRRSPSLVNP